MPKITTVKRRIAGTLTELVLSYDVKDSTFYISAGVPDKMQLLHSNYRLSGHDTQKAIEYALDKRIAEYEAQIKSERKVLLVTVALGDECRNALELPKTHPFRAHTVSGFDKTPDNYGFDLKVEVALETATGNQKQYRYTEDNEKKSFRSPNITKGMTRVVEWTPEREKYFKNMIAATLAVGQKLADFFTEDEQLFLNNIDNGQKLLG